MLQPLLSLPGELEIRCITWSRPRREYSENSFWSWHTLWWRFNESQILISTFLNMFPKYDWKKGICSLEWSKEYVAHAPSLLLPHYWMHPFCPKCSWMPNSTNLNDLWGTQALQGSQNHRMGKVGRDNLAQSLCSHRVPYSMLIRSMSRWLLNIPREGISTTSLDNLFQCSEEVSSHVQVKLPMFQFLPIASHPVAHDQEEPWSYLLMSSFLILQTLLKSPFSLLSSRLNSPSSLRLSSWMRYSSTLLIFVAFFWTCSRSSLSPLYWGAQNWSQHSRWRLTRAE